MFVKEFWGKGIATEFVQAFVDEWWKLPRSVCEIEVEKSTVPSNSEMAQEMYTAVTATDNFASQKILERRGFEKVKVWSETDSQDPTGMSSIFLFGFGMIRPRE
jgi:RimJ/RimL family protein N-acetyltransferase